jgi:hypothetical protein
MSIRRNLSIALVCLVGCMLTAERVTAQNYFRASSGETMKWQALPIGAGGFVTGIAVHPRMPEVVFARTDVGGLYGWRAGDGTWQQLLTEANRPAGAPPNVDSMGLDPRDPNTLYVALGADLATNGRFLKSIDRGGSWQVLSGPTVPVHGNTDFRWVGERWAVDPNNASIVYYGSATKGLWRSVNGGDRWTQVATRHVPVGRKHTSMAESGVTFVLFDPRASQLNGRTAVLYAGVSRQGIYRSMDAGETWQRILADDTIPQQAEIDAAGTLFVTFHGNGHQAQGKVARLDVAGWRTISPAAGLDFSAITVDRAVPGRLWVATHPLRPDGIFYSADHGQSWQRQTARMVETPGWWPDWSLWTLSGGMAHSPAEGDGLWLSTGLGILHTSEPAARSPRFRTRLDGVEATVTFDAVSTSGGALVTGIADFDGFRHDPLYGQPATTHGRGAFITTTSVAVMGGNQNVLASVGANHHEPWRRRAGLSTDNGRSWTDFASIRSGTHPNDLEFGTIALSATNGNNMVWQPTNWAPPYRTTDGGRTWQRLRAFEQSPFNGGAHTHLWNRQRPLAADAVLGGVFYLYHHVPGYLMRSIDGGASWQVASRNLPAGRWNSADLQAVPGMGGHLWLALGDGLYRSIDGGVRFARHPAISRATVVGFGAPQPGRTIPAAYLQGVVNASEGVFRSTDGGNSWVKIGEYKAAGNEPRVLTGDLNRYGRVVVGTGGNGFLVGEIATATMPIP